MLTKSVSLFLLRIVFWGCNPQTPPGGLRPGPPLPGTRPGAGSHRPRTPPEGFASGSPLSGTRFGADSRRPQTLPEGFATGGLRPRTPGGCFAFWDVVRILRPGGFVPDSLGACSLWGANRTSRPKRHPRTFSRVLRALGCFVPGELGGTAMSSVEVLREVADRATLPVRMRWWESRLEGGCGVGLLPVGRWRHAEGLRGWWLKQVLGCSRRAGSRGFAGWAAVRCRG